MTVEEYFGDWTEVINRRELSKVIRWLSTVDNSLLCPSKKDIFRAFSVCPYHQCNVICLGQDPYPQPGVATGILFGNKAETPESLLSPSLKVVKRAVSADSAFDNTMEAWARQGILMINTALTCVQNRIGSHVHMWRPFISSLIENISWNRSDIIFLLFGSQAKSFTPYIHGNPIVGESHPAYYARFGSDMPGTAFDEVNSYLKSQGKPLIKFT